jgi:hypothetical protein
VCQAGQEARVSVAPAERRESALAKPFLVTAQRSRRAAECSRDIVLIRKALLDERDHRVGLRHPIVEREVREWEAGDEDRATVRVCPQSATSVDDDRPVNEICDLLGEEIALLGGCCHARTMPGMRQKKRTGLGPRPPPAVSPDNLRKSPRNQPGTALRDPGLCQEFWTRSARNRRRQQRLENVPAPAGQASISATNGSIRGFGTPRAKQRNLSQSYRKTSEVLTQGLC